MNKNWVGTREEWVVMNFILYISNSHEILEYDTDNEEDMKFIRRVYDRQSEEDKKYLKKYVMPDKDQ